MLGENESGVGCTRSEQVDIHCAAVVDELCFETRQLKLRFTYADVSVAFIADETQLS